MSRDTYEVTIELEQYIAHPYWPQKDDLIEINKKSGIANQRTEAKRALALKGYLDKLGLTEEDYEVLKIKASRQFYRVDDDNEQSPIIIPRHQFCGMMVEAIKKAPKSIRGNYEKDSFRSHVRVGDFVTDRTAKDGTYDRFVKLETSHQRNRQKNDYITNVRAKGQVSLREGTDPKPLNQLMNFALDEIGVGSCRGQGYGRGKVVILSPIALHKEELK